VSYPIQFLKLESQLARADSSASKMDYPVSRELLQSMRRENMLIKLVVESICRGVEKTALNTTEYRYIYTIVRPLSEYVLLKISDELRERFTDCNVVIGKRCIYVDWY